MHSYFLRIRSIWNRYWFLLSEAQAHRSFQIGNSNSFNVPVRSSGHGSLIIGDRNSLGFEGAPRLGNGEILIQPRTIASEISIGDENSFSNNISIIATQAISIGNRCLLGDGLGIFDSDFHDLSPAKRWNSPGLAEAVKIGNNVWLGSRVVVLKGVSIGNNSVVGAMSLVTRSIPENSVAAGVPAKIIRSLV